MGCLPRSACLRLVEIPMMGRKFTRISDDGMKFSKLDQFLMNEEFNSLWGNLSVIALYEVIGPLSNSFKRCGARLRSEAFSFRDKLKNVKSNLRKWSKDRFGGNKEKLEGYKSEAMRWELEVEKRVLNDAEKNNMVESCLRSSTMSILVNGSSTEEFSLERGVRQGGFRIGNNSVVVSHLQYSDDIIFFDEWSKENAMSLMCILKCFEEVSGLRINYIKSKLYGVGVNDREIGDMVKWMRCGGHMEMDASIGWQVYGQSAYKDAGRENVQGILLKFPLHACDLGS
ncbi:hypothetical protein Tco_1354232 [Tanacetum coccineum]